MSTEQSPNWAEKLVDALETAKDRLSLAIGEEERAEAQAAYDRAHNDVIQALTGSQRTEEDDVLSVADHFAGLAMQGDFCSQQTTEDYGSQHFDALAVRAYKMADAMMSERARRMAGGDQ